jgi:NAD(P)-dependent dehydrogenase (short-subunit alcohol dehydrogenase family)
VNNAGVGSARTVEDATIGHFEDVLNANVLGIVRCTKEVLPGMRAAGGGAIVNVGSVTGRFAQPSMAAYTTSKFAVEGLTEVLAQEVAGFGIRVVLIEPGTIRTPIFAKSEPMPDGTAYESHYLRTIAFFAATLAAPTEPATVADVISNAITTDDYRFRYEVGPDAVSVLAARDQLTDEAFLAMAALGDDEYLEAFSTTFGVDIRG